MGRPTGEVFEEAAEGESWALNERALTFAVNAAVVAAAAQEAETECNFHASSPHRSTALIRSALE